MFRKFLNIDEQERKPILIGGPCSVESEQQVLDTALGLASAGIHVLRGGIWKPRTRPNSFEGVGEQGLVWLKNAGRAINIPVATEIAKPEHVELALKHGIDILWVGARTTVNPFLMQDIAEALIGVNVPVMVKNPVNPDVELWIGALERLKIAGVETLAAVHRGFSAYEVQQYRNAPMWEIPIELRRRLPDLEIIVDPSHIAGTRSLIPELAQTALDLGFDGLMVESHINPEVALSDAKQQLSPETFTFLVNALNIRFQDPLNPIESKELDILRQQIDNLDHEIIELIGKRMQVSREIGLWKQENNVAIYQPERWRYIFERATKKLIENGVSKEMAKELLQAIHKESIRQQSEEINAIVKK
jgi:chorismate mutase